MDVLDRVQKLLRLAGSANVHEAAAAAARAQALLLEHRLEGLLQAPEAEAFDDGRDTPLRTARRMRAWKAHLAAILADANDALAYTAAGPDGERLCVAGRAADRDAVRALYDALEAQIEWLSATVGPGRDRRWHEAFRVGAAVAIGERIRGEERTIPGLVLADAARRARKDAVRRFAEARLGVGKGRGKPLSARAYDAGKQAAVALKLSVR